MQKIHNYENNRSNLISEEKKDYLSLPSSPASDAIMRILEYRGDLKKMQERSKETSHGQEIIVGDFQKERKLCISGNNSEVTLEMTDIDLITGLNTNKTIKKMLVYILILINLQAYSAGSMHRTYIQFHLQELINIGFYTTPQSARKGFDHALNVLTSLKLKGTLRKGNKKEIKQSTVEVLFTGGSRYNGICRIYLNDRVNWDLITPFYTIIPESYFLLSNRASDLLYYLCYLARIRMGDITSKGYYTIGLKAIHARLNIIEVGKTKNPRRDSLAPILDAIDEIKNTCGTNFFEIETFYDDGNVSEILDSGYVRITCIGEFADYFKGIANKAAKQIEDKAKRNEAIIEKAKVAALASKIEKGPSA